LGKNLGRRVGKRATNRLSYGTAIWLASVQRFYEVSAQNIDRGRPTRFCHTEVKIAAFPPYCTETDNVLDTFSPVGETTILVCGFKANFTNSQRFDTAIVEQLLAHWIFCHIINLAIYFTWMFIII
jgi:hypothetical protein